jgi:hypothetical protein
MGFSLPHQCTKLLNDAGSLHDLGQAENFVFLLQQPLDDGRAYAALAADSDKEGFDVIIEHNALVRGHVGCLVVSHTHDTEGKAANKGNEAGHFLVTR